MPVGVLTIELLIPGNQSLKGKRSVIKSVMARLRNQFNVSVAEIGTQDAWQKATIGVATISSDADYAHGLLMKVVDAVSNSRLDAQVEDYTIEFC